MIAGEKAPDFTLYDHTGQARTLSALLSDGPVVLFFFPLASSPICTAQACHFRDLAKEFDSVNAQRVGISTDTVGRQGHFHQQRSFDYPLLSDTDGVVCEIFGVRRGRFAGLRSTLAAPKRGRHKRRRGLIARFLPVRRTTFVIDTDRTVLKVISSELRASAHADEALQFLRELYIPHKPPSEPESAATPSESAGRIDAGVELPLEAPIEALDMTATSPHWAKNDVRGQILTYCVESPSVAEIAARVSLPLGATRFLVDDLVTQGYLRVRATARDTMTIDERRDLLTRTLRGLQAL